MVPNEPGPEFEDLAAATQENAGIHTVDCIRAARAAADTAAAVVALHPTHNQPCLIKADPDKIMYDTTIELPDACLLPAEDVPP